MKRRALLAAPFLPLLAAPKSGETLILDLRSRAEVFRGSEEWREVTVRCTFHTSECALVLCDVWDRHWCKGATGRVNALVRRLAPFTARARRNGILVIHAPSDTMQFYKDAPGRLAALRAPAATTPAAKALTDPPLPIDDADGGCDTAGDKPFRAWSRQHPGIQVEAADLISDNGQEIYNALQTRGVKTLFVAGVHTNMCVLNRSFAIRQMTKWGIHCVLLRDLTDAMYDPQDRPFVSHERGTELVIEHIERYWAPTVTSDEMLARLPKA